MRVLLLLSVIVGLNACSSVKQPDLDIMSSKKQYCHTEQVVVHDKEKGKSDEVASRTVLTCSDQTDPMENKLVKMGVADRCGYFHDTINIGGQIVWYKQMACFVGDQATGRWVLIENPTW